MNPLYLIGFFLALLTAQHFFFMHQIHKLLDKLMARDYGSYVRANKPPQLRVQAPTEPVEDVNALPKLEHFM